MDLKLAMNKSVIWVRNILVLLIITMILITCANSNYASDDWVHYNAMLKYTSGNAIIRGIQYSINRWFEWGGVYFAFFIQTVLEPLAYENCFLALRIILVINAALFYGGMLFMTKVLCNYFDIKKEIANWIYAIVVWMIASFRVYSEVFYWLSGATSYTMPMICGFFSIALCVLAYQKENKWQYILAALLAFCTVGGALTVSGMFCYGMLGLFVTIWVRNKKFPVGIGCVFMIAVAGSLLNAVAPGNFVRYDGSGDVSFLSTMISIIKPTIKSCIEDFNIFKENQWILLFTVALFVLGTKIKFRTRKLYIGILQSVVLVIGITLWPFITAYPIVLGYKGEGLSCFVNRCIFMLDFCIILAWSILILYIGAFCKSIIPKKLLYGVIVLGICLASMKFVSKIEIAGNTGGYITYQDVISGRTVEFANAIEEIFMEIETSEEEHCVITTPPRPPVSCFWVYLSDDPNHFINLEVASYYGKESVRTDRSYFQ